MIRRLFACFLLGFLVFGCSKRSAEPASAVTAPMVVASAAPATTDVTAIPKASRALIVTVDMSLKVKDMSAAVATIRRETEDAGGYVSSSSTREDGGTIDLRVPADKVSLLRTKLSDAGEITLSSEKVDDVTEQRADLDARLKNARTEESRFLEIMSQKTGTIYDVINAEKELARVRETIEVLEAQKRTLEGQIALATIHVTLTTPAVTASQTPWASIASAFGAGVKAAETIAIYLAMAIAATSPTLVPIFAVGIALFLVIRRRRRAAAPA